MNPEHQKFLARGYVQVMFALGALLEHGTLPPGTYVPKNVSSIALREQMRQSDGTLIPLIDLNLNEQGGFAFTETASSTPQTHGLRLAQQERCGRVARWWPVSWAACRSEAALWPAFKFSSGYGDNLKDRRRCSRKMGSRSWQRCHDGTYTNLHRQMLFALQVFVENAELRPGSYTWAKP